MFEEITGCFLNCLAVGEIALAENVRNDWQIFCTQELLGNRLFKVERECLGMPLKMCCKYRINRDKLLFKVYSRFAIICLMSEKLNCGPLLIQSLYNIG
jgi:hypothetical protein